MRFLISVFLLALLVGCESYMPSPVDWRAEASAWTNGVSAVDMSLEDVRIRALAFNPRLNVLRLASRTSEGKAAESGWWEDPSIEGDALRILREHSNPYMWGMSVAFTLPLTGIPGLEKRIAGAYAEKDRWSIIAAEYEISCEAQCLAVEIAGLEALERKLETVLSDTAYVDANSVCGRLVKTGECSVTTFESLKSGERDIVASLGEIRRSRVAAESSLSKLLLLPPGVKMHLRGIFVETAIPADKPDVLSFVRHPSVRAAMAKYEGDETALKKEIARQYPELSLGPSYSREDGYNRVGLAGSLTLPLWNRNRVGIAEAKGVREETRAALIEAWREEVLKWNELLGEREVLEKTCPPDVDEERLETAAKLYSVGEVDAWDYVASVQGTVSAIISKARYEIDLAKTAIRISLSVECLKEKDVVK